MSNSRRGQIITFYSYKGGVGRSMALANVAWILASQGKKVLVIDWDLEAPGLHRYFAPFLLDKELSESDGLLEWMTAFADAVTTPPSDDAADSDDWFEPLVREEPYSIAVDYPFPSAGGIHLIPAGRQDRSYASRANTFNWARFYDRMGGGAFLNAIGHRLRDEYDFILIDSRTGASDTAGICTLQMPDCVVACFTANTQSIEGVARVIEAIRGREPMVATDAAGAQSEHQVPVRVIPVLTRVERGDQMHVRRRVAQQRIGKALESGDILETESSFGDEEDRPWHVLEPPGDRDDVQPSQEMHRKLLLELPYVPYYTYEEVLAALADRPSERIGLLAAIEALARNIGNDTTFKAVPPDDATRKRILTEFLRGTSPRLPSAAEAARDKMYAPIHRPTQEGVGEQCGRISTFYSYKGGVGRTMALANVAWILARHGKRVLAIDWDLEAPGLHRYFAPWLDDPELANSPGLMDHFGEFADAATTPWQDENEPEPNWYVPYADLAKHAVKLDYFFPLGGSLDFLSAGRQDAAYATNVNSFDWMSFYERLGGGSLLEAARIKLLEKYDYVLIDSRTGASDTSGICTMQLPDTVVILFTANNQSIWGAANVAARLGEPSDGGRTKRVLPVFTRADVWEKDRLDAASEFAEQLFAPCLADLSSDQARAYWAETKTPHVPDYAYEEVAASLAEAPKKAVPLLSAIEALVGYLTGGTVRPVTRADDGFESNLDRTRDLPSAVTTMPASSSRLVPREFETATAPRVREAASTSSVRAFAVPEPSYQLQHQPTSKQRASRIPLDHFKHRDGIESNRLKFTLIALAVSATLAIWFIWRSPMS